MAFILGKSLILQQDGQAAPSSPLARASFDRQRDIYQLAKMGNRDSARMWNDFARESPQMARVVVADVQADQVAATKANKSVDKRLRKAEKLVTKGQVKPVRSKSAVKAIEKALTTDAVKMVERFAISDNPADRALYEQAQRDRYVH